MKCPRTKYPMMKCLGTEHPPDNMLLDKMLPDKQSWFQVIHTYLSFNVSCSRSAGFEGRWRFYTSDGPLSYHLSGSASSCSPSHYLSTFYVVFHVVSFLALLNLSQLRGADLPLSSSHAHTISDASFSTPHLSGAAHIY